MEESKSKEKSPLEFSPITEGLGFHPFSDGLPYAPTTKTPPSAPAMGTGAVAAGPPQFVRPVRSARTAAPQAVKTAVKAITPPPTIRPPAKTISIPQAAAAVVAPQSIPVLETKEKLGAIYLLKRVFAYGLDWVLNWTLCLGAALAALMFFNLPVATQLSSDAVTLGVLGLLVAHGFLNTLQEMLFKTTIGKRLFGLKLEGKAGAILLRAIAFPISVIFFGAGLIWAIFDSKRRCWHDIASKVAPVEIAQL